MELILNSSPDSRLAALTHWLESIAQTHDLDPNTLEPASSDASFRRYFRLNGKGGTVIVMDAPPAQEDCQPFLHAGQLLENAGLNVPNILAQDLSQGFLLLSDLGKQTYYQAIVSGIDDGRLQQLYREAINALVHLQKARTTGLPPYDQERLAAELTLFPHWYAQEHCQAQLTDKEQAMLQKTFALLVQDNAQQATVFVHRDFHSPNLMVCDRPEYGPNPGIIDYQDALAGPLTYDLASLVMDARTTWEEPQQLDWAIRYWEAAKAAELPITPDFAEFHRAYEWMSLQRNLRILGVFARLSHRDGKSHYLQHMPRVNTYVRQVAHRYGVFHSLLRLLDKLDGRQVTTGYTF